MIVLMYRSTLHQPFMVSVNYSDVIVSEMRRIEQLLQMDSRREGTLGVKLTSFSAGKKKKK